MSDSLQLQTRMLAWVAFPFFRGSSYSRDWTWVSCIVGRFLHKNEIMSELPGKYSCLENSLNRGGWRATVHGVTVGHDWATFTFIFQWLIICFFFPFILDYRNDVRQKANSSKLFEFKMGCKAAEKTWNINNAFSLMHWWFKKFGKGDKNLEDEKHSSRPSEVDNNQLRASRLLNNNSSAHLL